MLNSGFDAIASIDHRGLILEWNPAAERLLGHARSDVLEKPLTEVMEFVGPPGTTVHVTFQPGPE